jgi:Ca-activated chloride channel family protein
VELNQLHFSHPMWLWGTLVVPLIWMFYFFFYKADHPQQKLEKFIDAHLLPYLLIKNEGKKQSGWKSLLLWSFLWSLLIFAIAGPRWNFREIDASSKDQSLVILLDLSESMNATDIRPSRLIRAKQKIEDILNSFQGVKIGLVAFAADPHMIAPITDDKETLRYLLPSLDTDLVYVQGSRLSGALEMADTMLQAEPGNNKALLIISDGDFEDSSLIAFVKKLAGKGIVVHVLGIGTTEGAILQNKQGNNFKKHGNPIFTKLSKNSLEEIARAGKGIYLEGKNGEEEIIIQQLENRAESLVASQKKQIWEEHFYLLILPALPIMLWWFREGTLFAFLFILLVPNFSLQAGIKENYFMNSEERGKLAFDNQEYTAAIDAFEDSYRRGVAYYKLGNYPEAEKMFRESSRKEVAIEAEYNLGNALALQNKLKEAIAAYETVLTNQPNHTKAKENLEILKKLMQQQKQEEQSKNSEEKDQNTNNQDQKQEKKQSQGDKENQDQNEKSESNEDSPENNKEQSDKNQSDHQQEQNSESQKQQENKDQDSKHNESSNQNDLENKQDEAQKDDSNQFAQNEAEAKQSERSEQEEKEMKAILEGKVKSQEDQDADFWLNRINNDPKNFMKKKFYIESKRSGTKEGVNPW